MAPFHFAFLGKSARTRKQFWHTAKLADFKLQSSRFSIICEQIIIIFPSVASYPKHQNV